MKIIFFGLGSIGQRHARLLQESRKHELFALRSQCSDASEPDFPIHALKNWDEVDKVRPEVAFITNPTALHIETAVRCAERGMALFLEKPLGASEKGLDELLRLIKEKSLVTYVAYVLRFHPVIIQLKEILEKNPGTLRIEAASFLPTWRPGRDLKKSYSSLRELGGGVVFDLSHEIDYVNYILGPVENIEGVCAKRGNVTVDAEDSADMYIMCREGRFASIHLSFLSHLHQRQIIAYLQESTVVADLIKNDILIYKENAVIEQMNFSIEREELFRRQLNFFFSNIDNPSMSNNIIEASNLFRKICLFKQKCYVD
ncbi:MAG: Gfo/Idh/MocA family oxidoreductase [Candidatus Omnitrophica bacterium]|nr:Gfo/Idh/MocA family oxidoreductase [Candidatus Omnitrophota bacterium]